MNIEPNQWIEAEKIFHKWIEDSSAYPVNNYTELRKAIHRYFNNDYRNWLAHVIKQVLVDLPIDNLLKEEIKRYEYKIKVRSGEIVKEDFGIRYRIAPFDHESYNKKILRALWSGDSEIIYEFYEKEFSSVAHLIIKNSGTIEDAKDIFQDALIILMDKFKWNKFDLSCNIGSYIYSVCRNLWYENLRRIKKESEFIETKENFYDNISTEYYKEEPDVYQQVSNVINSLGDPCKELLELYYFGNFSWKKIASHLGYASAASARNQKYKCLERIRKELISKE